MPCTTILVGNRASNDGSTIIARNDDGSFNPKQVLLHKAGSAKTTYKTVLSHLTVELPEHSLRYTSVPNVNRKEGLWPTCGINEANVAMTATETVTSNSLVLGADPYVVLQPKKGRGGREVPGGIGEEDLVTLILPYIRTAREGVLRLGELLEKYGTYEPNGMAFADADEIWWAETIGGHHFIARRVPDDRVVIMPNQFGLDNFDFEDALGEGKEHLCSRDLKEFTEKYCLYTGREGESFNPRLAYGSRSDSDHIYNTPRAWFMGSYFLENEFRRPDGSEYTPESNDIPWSFVPRRKVTVEEVRYVLGSYYQGTEYNPYDQNAAHRGKYRTIGVPNSDVVGIMQIRGGLPEAIKGVEWLSLGGSGFTACFPVYAGVSTLPAYISATGETVSTENAYWQSRLIAALTDAHYNAGAILLDERYQNAVANRARALLNEYDEKYLAAGDEKLLEEANKKLCAMVKEESDKALGNLLGNASEHMRIRYHRGDN